jgi:hypothetical protein
MRPRLDSPTSTASTRISSIRARITSRFSARVSGSLSSRAWSCCKSVLAVSSWLATGDLTGILKRRQQRVTGAEVPLLFVGDAVKLTVKVALRDALTAVERQDVIALAQQGIEGALEVCQLRAAGFLLLHAGRALRGQEGEHLARIANELLDVGPDVLLVALGTERRCVTVQWDGAVLGAGLYLLAIAAALMARLARVVAEGKTLAVCAQGLFILDECP